MIGLAAAQLQEFLVREFPFTNMQVEAVGDGQARVRMPVLPRHLRPGGTVSGPTLMTLADTAMYMALLGEIGLVALAVTTSLTINFLRRPAAECDLLGEARLLKVGRRLAVGEVFLYSAGQADPVAHATVTYAIPQETEGSTHLRRETRWAAHRSEVVKLKRTMNSAAHC